VTEMCLPKRGKSRVRKSSYSIATFIRSSQDELAMNRMYVPLTPF